jgi:hypothetical protein
MVVQDLVLPAQAFLAEQGVYPDAEGRYDEESLERVIRDRGWIVSWDGQTGDWLAEIGDQVATTQFRYAVGGGPDRATALLRALELALTWRDDDEAHRVFDQRVYELLGISGEDFRRQWYAGDYAQAINDPQDPDHAALQQLLPFLQNGWPVGW